MYKKSVFGHPLFFLFSLLFPFSLFPPLLNKFAYRYHISAFCLYNRGMLTAVETAVATALDLIKGAASYCGI
jgi:hypothetical protein